MKRLLKCIMLLCMLWQTANAQPYEVGDVIDKDVALPMVLNYSKTKASLSAFMNKPLVLVYWHYTCGTCMGMFKWLDSLTEGHKNTVNFLLVTTAEADKVKTLLKENKHMGKMKIPFVVADEKLRQWFPYYSVPHVVWIDGDKKVQAITGHGELNDANLLSLASGVTMDLPLKEEAIDKREYYSIDPMILYNFEKHRKSIKKYSLITGERKGISNHISMGYRDSFTRVNQTNTSVYELYKTAYGLSTKHRSLVEFKQKQQYAPNRITGENVYCYDLLVKTGSKQEGLRYMQEDLDQYFNLHSRLERRWVDCYLLQRVDSVMNGNNTKTDSFTGMEVRKITTSFYLVEVLDRIMDKPVVNETGIAQNIVVYLPKYVDDAALYLQYLHQQGFVLAEGKREQTVLILE